MLIWKWFNIFKFNKDLLLIASVIVLCALISACQPRIEKIDTSVKYLTFCEDVDLGYVVDSYNPDFVLSATDELDIKSHLLGSSKVKVEDVIDIKTRRFLIYEVYQINDKSLEYIGGHKYNILILSDDRGKYFFVAYDNWLSKLTHRNCYYPS